ncbi:hypothetical protein Val02_08610 [Virgisporangium aliadipatigenens]|uniref:Suppressor of fused-like domain-containing protein n=2 Tax=Virgisporangium aliadipatigenens TaxID=741659 RepID=A0A8J4DMN6_9ACTN|nr:hypothetical protein Val02_08610 [Virgisporangium aliadipatigenens]
MQIDAKSVHSGVAAHIRGVWPGRTVVRTRMNSIDYQEDAPQIANEPIEVLEIAPEKPDGAWVYASWGAWQTPTQGQPLSEFLLVSLDSSMRHVETVYDVITLHADGGGPIRLYETLNLGRPWQPGSACEHLLVAPPYIIDEGLGEFEISGVAISLSWLIPITASEVEFAYHHGGFQLGEEIAQAEVNVFEAGRPAVR